MRLGEHMATRGAMGHRSSVVTDDFFNVNGMMNLVDSPLLLAGGTPIGAKNFEPRLPSMGGGIERKPGFERFDGQTAPSAASYWILNYDGEVATPPVANDQVDGGTSGASGICLATVDNGTDGYVVLARLSGTFVNDEDLEVSAVKFADADGTTTENAASTDALHETYRAAAEADARALITTVPGSGQIRGVAMYDGTVYALRDNAGATAQDLYKSTASGWTQVTLNRYQRFDAGTARFTEGATLTGGTSTATAPILRVVVKTGAFESNDAVGYIMLGTITGGPFQNNEAITDGSGGAAVADGADAAQGLDPAGRWSFVVHNFYASSATRRLYGADGVNNAIEFDGTTWTFLETGMPTDTPQHLAIHNNHLLLSFPGGSIQNSAPGRPSLWTALTGALEMGHGDEVVGFRRMPGAQETPTTFVYGRQRIKVLYGKVREQFQLIDYADEIGAFPYTEAKLGPTIFLDDRGFTTLFAVDAFGNFQQAVITQKIDPLVKALLPPLANPTAAAVSRRRNVYRCYFDDNTAIAIGFAGNEITGAMQLNYGMVVRVIWSDEDSDVADPTDLGEERIFFGSDDGYIYEDDKGLNFDSLDIEAFVRLSFYHSGRPELVKHYYMAQLELETTGDATLSMSYDVNYGDPALPVKGDTALALSGGGGYWDIDNWGAFKYATGAQAVARITLDVDANNIGFLFYHKQSNEPAFVIKGITLQWRPMRINRRADG